MVDKRTLTAKMIQAGYTQRSLASAMGVSKNTICEKINGRRPFNTEEVETICKILSITSGQEKLDIFLAEPSQNRDERTLVETTTRDSA